MVPRTNVQRIVSLAPSATSILFAIGARSQVVGVSKWCADVADVGNLPRLGDCWSLETESIAKLKPTLVIGSVPYRQEAVSKLLEQPIAFFAMNPRTIEDVYNDILMLGRISARESSAKKVIAKMRSEFETILAAANRSRRSVGAKTRKPRVYCESWPHPRVSSPPWVAELVQIAGGEMVVPPGQRVGDAQVAAAAPDVIVLAWAAMGDKSDINRALELAAWKQVPAVLNNRVFSVRDELLNTPGPPLVRGAKELSRIIHSERVTAVTRKSAPAAFRASASAARNSAASK
jgi:iron complex transport system substrate-binding protein